MSKILGWAPKVKITRDIAKNIDACPSIKYTDEQKITRIKSILAISTNVEEMVKLIKFVVND